MDEDSSTEQITRQVYSFGKRNVFMLQFSESRETTAKRIASLYENGAQNPTGVLRPTHDFIQQGSNSKPQPQAAFAVHYYS